MTTPSDEELINMATKHFYYKTLSPGDNVIGKIDAAEIQTLLQQWNSITDKITLAEIQEETSNESYLDSKAHPWKYGLFSSVGLRTTQDWVLAYFFFSYVVFSVFVTLSHLVSSTNKILTAAAWAGTMFGIGVMLFIGVMSFG